MFIPVLIKRQVTFWQAVIKSSKNIRECGLHSYVEAEIANI
jgi:hypothetical protein